MGSGREYGVKTVQITEREHLSCSLCEHRLCRIARQRSGRQNFLHYSDLKLRKLFLAPLTKDFQDISLALKASEGQDGDEASNIFVKLVKDMSVMQFDDRASFRVVARSVDGDGEEGDPK